MTSRVLSQHGNVIAADLRSRTELTVEIKTETLYQDDQVLLTRASFTCGGKPISKLPTQHFFADLRTGEIYTT